MGNKTLLHLKHWGLPQVSINKNPIWILLLYLSHPTCERVEWLGKREGQPPQGVLCFRMVHQPRWNWAVEGHFKLEQVGEVGVWLLFGSQEGHLWGMGGSDCCLGSWQEWRPVKSQGRLEWELVGEISCDKPAVGKSSRDWCWYEIVLPGGVRLECPLVTNPQRRQTLLVADLLLRLSSALFVAL